MSISIIKSIDTFKLGLCASVLFHLPLALADELSDLVTEEIEHTKAMPNLSAGQFLAVPIPVSNPTIGTGLQVALLYLHPEAPDSGNDTPNGTTGIGAMYTDTESSVYGLFHDDYLFDDKLRLRGGFGVSDVNIDYYGSNIDPGLDDSRLEYNLKSNFGMLQTLARIPGTQNWFAGLRAMGMQADISFDLGDFFENLPPFSADMTIANLAIVSNYDTRDNNYYPTSGRYFQASFAKDDESFGSDYNFNRYSTSYNQYFALNEANVIAVRGVATEVSGDIPFFLLPSLDMRGFSSGRYQDEAVMSAHIEWRHKFSPRWGFIVSAEAGKVGDSIGELSDRDTITSVGAGIRWQVSKDQPMHLGIDVGYSGDESAIYIQIGERF